MYPIPLCIRRWCEATFVLTVGPLRQNQITNSFIFWFNLTPSPIINYYSIQSQWIKWFSDWALYLSNHSSPDFCLRPHLLSLSNRAWRESGSSLPCGCCSKNRKLYRAPHVDTLNRAYRKFGSSLRDWCSINRKLYCGLHVDDLIKNSSDYQPVSLVGSSTHLNQQNAVQPDRVRTCPE